MFKRVVAMAMVLAMVLGFSACGDKNEDGSATGEYVIGFSGPLTGGAAVYGKAVQNAAQMAVDEINAAGGLNGVPFRLVALDDTHDPTKIAKNYATLMDKEGMQVSLGTVTTGPGLEFSALSVEDNVFFLTPSASGDDIPKNPNGYQMCFADGNQGKVAADYVNSLGLKKIGIFYKNDDAYSNGIFKQFKDNLNKDIATVETVFAGEASDFTAQINQLKECEFIFMPIYYEPAAIFMKQAKNTIPAKAVYYGCDGFDGLAGQLGDDFKTIPQKISMLSHFDSNAKDGKAAEFIKKYTEKFGAETLNQFGASAYDCIYAIYNAMKAAIDSGKEIPTDIAADELCEILKAQFNGGFKFSGVTGTDITWESNGYVKKQAKEFVLKEAN